MANGLSGNCAICGTWRRSLHRDHIIPRFKGGTDEPENIQLICASCHEDKTVEDLRGRRHTPEERERQRQAQLGSKRDEITRLRMSLAHLQKVRDDDNYAAQLKTMAYNQHAMSTIRRICNDCGLESNPSGMGRHLKSACHVGYTEIRYEGIDDVSVC